VLASLVALSGVNPVSVVEYSIVFSVVILPLTYFPVLMIARDKRIMRSHANGLVADGLGCVAALHPDARWKGMKAAIHFDLMRDLLDHELVDCDGTSCGMVDDVELSPSGRGSHGLVVVALWAGPGAWAPRLPAFARILVRAIAGARRRRIDFGEVAEISEVIHLKSSAASLRLGIADRKAGRWLARWERQ
jgi:hypothetical protein